MRIFMPVLTACLVCGIFLQFLLLLRFLVKDRQLLAKQYNIFSTAEYEAAIALKDCHKEQIKRIIGWRELTLVDNWAWDRAMQEIVKELRGRLRKPRSS